LRSKPSTKRPIRFPRSRREILPSAAFLHSQGHDQPIDACPGQVCSMAYSGRSAAECLVWPVPLRQVLAHLRRVLSPPVPLVDVQARERDVYAAGARCTGEA
jgi:hypothetical protein